MICRARRLVLLALILAAPGLCPAAVNAGGVARLKALPPPLQSPDGVIYVGCATPERAELRWPVLRFASTVRDRLSGLFGPLGSPASPLSIELGAETNRVETLARKTLRTQDGFSQLIIRVPNPDTVDLELLRTAIAEALFREQARAQGASYASLTWPRWFVAATVDATRGDVWRAEAYERFLASPTPPLPLDAFFAQDAAPPPEQAAFFAQWALKECKKRPEAARRALLNTPWERQAILGEAADEAWQAWLKDLDNTLFLPGILTRRQFERWCAKLTDPADPQEAVRIANALTKEAIGRPAVFRDLTELYLRAYAAAATGDRAAYAARRAEADEARAALQSHFQRNALIVEENPSPHEP